jgi:hypothetical protein
MFNYTLLDSYNKIIGYSTVAEATDAFLEKGFILYDLDAETQSKIYTHDIFLIGQEILIKPKAIDYRELRMLEYPSLSDFSDALYWQEQGDPSKMDLYLAKVAAVKYKYPKP